LILEHWDLVEADMHERYGIDLSAPGLLTQRSGRWLAVRICGLFGGSGLTPSRLAARLLQAEEGGE
jgi:hypothetical protein